MINDVNDYKDLPGVRVYDLKIIPDERGFFMETLRSDWTEFLGEDQIIQFNTSFNYPGMIRAWHRHLRGQVDYFFVVSGALKICAYDDREESPSTRGKLIEIISSSKKPQLVRVPGIYWHGFKNISNEPTTLFYLVNRMYDYQNPDEQRRIWNDSSIINPKTKGVFDWNAPPHK
jgi:dTDP-4-dehydrorhamnose 3,5-epimerase